MEPLKIQIELTASERLFQTLEAIGGAIFMNLATKVVNAKDAPAADAEPEAPCVEEPGAAKEGEQPEESHEVTEEDDLPPDDAPEKEVTDMELFDVVAAVKDRSGKDAVRKVFNDFGIKCSRDCPKERRAALVRTLNALPNA